MDGKTFRRIAFCFFAAAATLYGGAKNIIGKITYPRTDPEVWYLADNGSYVTNDSVHVDFARSIIVPASANFFIEACPAAITNQDKWAANSTLVYSNVFARMSVPFDLDWPAATNFNFIAYTDWVPPPVVHTNGVAFVMWQQAVGKEPNDLAITRTGIYIGAERVKPDPAMTNGPAARAFSTINNNGGEDDYDNE